MGTKWEQEPASGARTETKWEQSGNKNLKGGKNGNKVGTVETRTPKWGKEGTKWQQSGDKNPKSGERVETKLKQRGNKNPKVGQGRNKVATKWEQEPQSGARMGTKWEQEPQGGARK